MKQKIVLLKLSGESLIGNGIKGSGIDPEKLEYYATEICDAVTLGTGLGIVIGGGNIYRGLESVSHGMDRVSGDYMGMLATLINAIALQSRIEEKGVKSVLLSGIVIDGLSEKATRFRAMDAISKGKVVIFAGGTGNPFFTTDTAAALRAAEIKADLLLKGTRVDGVYTADPEIHPEAKKINSLSFDEAIRKGYKILDITAFTMCRENRIPIIVFNINRAGSLKRLLNGEQEGTVINV